MEISSLHLMELVSALARTELNVAVLGDTILDEYVHVGPVRKSPEDACMDATVPFLDMDDNQSHRYLGGAANVAQQLSGFAGRVTALFPVNDQVVQQLSDLPCPVVTCDAPRHDAARIPVKRRFVDGDRQVFRLGVEPRPYADYGHTQVVDSLWGNDSWDALVVSDYDKGMLTPRVIEAVMQHAAARDQPVVIDTKRPQFYRVPVGTLASKCKVVLRMNWPDAQAASGHQGPASAARYLCVTSGLSVVITNGNGTPVVASPNHYGGEAKVVFAKPDRGCSWATPYRARGAYTSGAGDTFTAFLALGLGAKMQLHEAVLVANMAATAGVYQMPQRTPVVPQDVLAMSAAALGKIHTQETLARWAYRLCKPYDSVVAVVNGCFDLLHAGHLQLLAHARRTSYCGVVVFVNSDEYIARVKEDGRPINKLDRRLLALASLSDVDAVVPFSEDTPEAAMRSLNGALGRKIDFLVKGVEYRHKAIPEETEANAVEFVDGGNLHTSDLIEYMSAVRIDRR